jgi:hypothetical protein
VYQYAGHVGDGVKTAWLPFTQVELRKKLTNTDTPRISFSTAHKEES